MIRTKNTSWLKTIVAVLSLLSADFVAAQEEDSTMVDTVSAVGVTVYFDSIRFEQTYKPHSLPDSVISRLKKKEAFWYADQSPTRKQVRQTNAPTALRTPFFMRPWFKTLVWILIIVSFIAVVIWFLIVSDVRVFRKTPSIIRQDAEEQMPENIFSISFEPELKSAIAAGNLRMATRLMYLHILKMLAEKEIIDYRADRTNSEYLYQVFNTSYYPDLLRLTRSFEYVWYGRFDLQEPVFNAVQKHYQTLKHSLS